MAPERRYTAMVYGGLPHWKTYQQSIQRHSKNIYSTIWNLFRPVSIILSREVNTKCSATRSSFWICGSTCCTKYESDPSKCLERKNQAQCGWKMVPVSWAKAKVANQLWAHHARVRKDESVCSSKTTWRQRVSNPQSQHLYSPGEFQQHLTLLSTHLWGTWGVP